MLIKKIYDLYWTPCAAHCIDLIFEDIGKKESVCDVIAIGRSITNFIYNHLWLLSQMREFCKGDIVRPGATRFATNYIALDSLLNKKAGLKALFSSETWEDNPLSRTKMGKQALLPHFGIKQKKFATCMSHSTESPDLSIVKSDRQ